MLGLSSGANLALEAAAGGLEIEMLALWEQPYALGGWPRPPEELAHTFAYDTLLLGAGTLPAAQAAAVRAPTLVMEGAESFPFMRGIAGALAGLIPGAQARVLKGQGHNVDPDDLVPVLGEFFAD